jgi:hypothetical protein
MPKENFAFPKMLISGPISCLIQLAKSLISSLLSLPNYHLFYKIIFFTKSAGKTLEIEPLSKRKILADATINNNNISPKHEITSCITPK